jgi:hypothetical protein
MKLMPVDLCRSPEAGLLICADEALHEKLQCPKLKLLMQGFFSF